MAIYEHDVTALVKQKKKTPQTVNATATLGCR